MDTISHGLWTYMLTRGYPRRWYVVLGAVFSDFLIIGMALMMFVKGELKISAPWLPQLYANPVMPVLDSFAHSLVIWTTVMAAAMFFRIAGLKWFVYGVYFHILIDIVTHREFLPGYLFPLSDLTFSGPVDYRTIGFNIVNIVLLSGFAGFLWYRRRRHNI